MLFLVNSFNCALEAAEECLSLCKDRNEINCGGEFVD